MPARESSLKRSALAYLKKRPNCYALKYFGGPFGHKGHPDLYGVDRGRAFAIELKQEGETATAIQTLELARWRAAGALTGVAHNLEELIAILDSIASDRPGGLFAPAFDDLRALGAGRRRELLRADEDH